MSSTGGGGGNSINGGGSTSGLTFNSSTSTLTIGSGGASSVIITGSGNSTVMNPLTRNLDAGLYNITNINTLQSDIYIDTSTFRCATASGLASMNFYNCSSESILDANLQYRKVLDTATNNLTLRDGNNNILTINTPSTMTINSNLTLNTFTGVNGTITNIKTDVLNLNGGASNGSLFWSSANSTIIANSTIDLQNNILYAQQVICGRNNTSNVDIPEFILLNRSNYQYFLDVKDNDKTIKIRNQGVANFGYIIDSFINPPVLSFDNTYLKLSAFDPVNNSATTTLSNINLSNINLNSSYLNTTSGNLNITSGNLNITSSVFNITPNINVSNAIKAVNTPYVLTGNTTTSITGYLLDTNQNKPTLSISGSNIILSAVTPSTNTSQALSTINLNTLPSSAVPVGSIILYAGTNPLVPTNYLICDGSAYSISTYNALYTVLGSAWINLDDATKFNVPDLLDRFPIGVGNGGSYSLGQKGGLNYISIGADNLPAHTHAINDNGHSHSVIDTGHAHQFGQGGVYTGGIGQFRAGDPNTGGPMTSTATTGVLINSSPTNITVGNNTTAHATINSTPPFLGLVYLIRYQ